MRVPEQPEKHPHSELTHSIIGAAIAVQKVLGPGMDEKLYENAICIELSERGINFKQEEEFSIFYKKKFIGKLIPDLIVDDTIILELKVADSFSQAHDAQLIGYLNATGLPLGLLLNFKVVPLGKRRILAPKAS